MAASRSVDAVGKSQQRGGAARGGYRIAQLKRTVLRRARAHNVIARAWFAGLMCQFCARAGDHLGHLGLFPPIIASYSEWLKDDAGSPARTGDVVARCRYQLALARIDTLYAGISAAVTYHDSCHWRRPRRPRARALLRSFGDRLIRLPEADLCCGSAGTNLTEPEGAGARPPQADNILATGAGFVILSNRLWFGSRGS
jgi:hypothetical protein